MRSASGLAEPGKAVAEAGPRGPPRLPVHSETSGPTPAYSTPLEGLPALLVCDQTLVNTFRLRTALTGEHLQYLSVVSALKDLPPRDPTPVWVSKLARVGP